MAQRYFSKEVLAEAEAIALESRLWERPQMPGVTIDGVESRDLDDAIWIQDTDDGVTLSVHVADVGECIPPGSRLEKTAFERTQTRYLRHGNEPMFPHILSENRLSLRQGEARPTLTVMIHLDREAAIQSVEIFESWICSLQRFSYAEVDQLLRDESSSFYSFLNSCLMWADRLYQQRTDPSLLADQPEGSWLDENGTWIVNEGTRYKAYLIIQEFMIVANTAIAQWMSERGLTALYRNHIPDIEGDVDELFQMLSRLGWQGALHRQLQSGLNRAEYALNPLGHFALKRLAYCHFTSPIRRLADLLNHRIIKAYLQNGSPPYSLEQLESLRLHIEAVIHMQLQETKDFFKAVHQEKYERLLQQPKCVNSLPDSEFSLLLRYAAKSDQIEKIVDEACDRMDQLPVEDWFVLLCLTQENRARTQVLSMLGEQVFQAPSIIAIAQNQLEEWGDIKYQVIGQSPFTAWLEVDIEGTYWTTLQGASHQRKQGAKHRACLLWLRAFCQQALLPSEQVEIVEEFQPLPDSSDHEELENAIGQLNEWCQKHQLSHPTYQFYEHDSGGFQCECALIILEKTVIGMGAGARKTSAKQNAAQDILRQLSEEMTFD